MPRNGLLVAALLLLPTFVAAEERSTSALRAYVENPDDSYRWVERRRGTTGDASYVELTLTSQTWHGTAWKHQLFIVKPGAVRNGSRAILYIGGGRWSDKLEGPVPADDSQLPGNGAAMVALAGQIQAPIAVLQHVPHQPLFGGMVEDQIISYTFEQYLKTGDDTWPLLLPMVKSAVRGMDAVQKFAQDEWKLPLDKFLVTGASKRGWTTWLTAAVDPRVEALAPMVIDTLNMGPQMKHQLLTWGRFSDQIHDYTDRGIQKYMPTERGQALERIVDPYQYRQSLVQPKLIILGTNDRYWTLDALNLYWNDLVGEKYVLYVPNQGHGIRDAARLGGTLAALYRHIAGQQKLAKLDWKLAEQEGHLSLELKTDLKPQQASAWIATAPTRDFRDAQWKSQPIESRDGVYRHKLPRPGSGYAAMFGEAVFATDRMPYYLSTNVKIVGPAETAKTER
jgi:PhoPQ-activated pathogenicity-related protein